MTCSLRTCRLLCLALLTVHVGPDLPSSGDEQTKMLMMMWLTPLKPSAVRLLGRPPPLGVRDFL
ncbi:hypothetical protein HaLaN_32511 [Haematococcus lacustris]|uniref:Uncharacterized protein n=1 Tax=Haematococcus lacustris TaxID=44745 RepID=A0A6A0ALK9_HAELA|nr:hypothetical protein HaLaN_32511 [Haematococcus lacustris]